MEGSLRIGRAAVQEDCLQSGKVEKLKSGKVSGGCSRARRDVSVRRLSIGDKYAGLMGVAAFERAVNL
jgi:hypothetical protein